jgi:hypothetical protein
VPWTIKPIFGLLSDFVPLLGSHRRNHLLLANAMAAVSLILLAFAPLSPGNRWVMFALLLPTPMAIALGDVIVDALMVLGGFVAEEHLQTLAFAGCAALWLFGLIVTWLYASDEYGEDLVAVSLHETGAALIAALRDPLFLAVCALLTLWSFNPLWGSVLYVHMTEDLGFSEQQFGDVTSAFFLGSLLGSIGYGIYCRSVRLSSLLFEATKAPYGRIRVQPRRRGVSSCRCKLLAGRSGLEARCAPLVGLPRSSSEGVAHQDRA